MDNENKDLKFLKKHYGENFAHLCRTLFPTLLEHEGKLTYIISKHFAYSRSLYNDILPFKDEFQSFVYSYLDSEAKKECKVTKSPTELLDEAGYILYPECQTEEDIQSFKKYWAKGEELCTFRGGRLDSCRVWFAIKKDIDKIKREDFKKPERQDEYGTSAISIQFSRSDKSVLSIKNRYNHAVLNPDSTFGNNLNNIINGLEHSFKVYYGIKTNSSSNSLQLLQFALSSYRMGEDEKFYKSFVEAGNICYCENNIILNNGKVVELDKSRYILADKFIIDTQKNEIKEYHGGIYPISRDGFIDSLGEIKKISVSKNDNDERIVTVTPTFGENIEITLNKSNRIIGYSNPNVKEIKKNFLNYNSIIKNISLPNVEVIENDFLKYNAGLKSLDLPNVRIIGDVFLSITNDLTSLNAPKLEEVGNSFLQYNNKLKSISLPNLKTVGNSFLMNNDELESIDLPKLKTVGNDFLFYNKDLEKLSLQNLESAGDNFLVKNRELTDVNLPKLKSVGNSFLYENYALENLSLPSLEVANDDFLMINRHLKEIYLPELKEVGDGFLKMGGELEFLSLPKLEKLPYNFAIVNQTLKKLYLPKVECINENFLPVDNNLESLYAPNLKDYPEDLEDKIVKDSFQEK